MILPEPDIMYSDQIRVDVPELTDEELDRFIDEVELPSESEEEGITFELPLPPNILSMNGRPHWAAKAKAKAQYRADCYAVYREALGPILSRYVFNFKVEISYEVFQGKVIPKDGLLRVRDERNLGEAFKIAEDAMVDAWIIKDDSRNYVTLGKVILHSQKESGKRMCILLTVKPL